MKAFIKTDPREDPEILYETEQRLNKQGIRAFYTYKKWQDIKIEEPFLYYRNPYLRFDKELLVAEFHQKNPNFKFIHDNGDELISVSPLADASHPFVVNDDVYFKSPKYDPLPIMLVTHRRPGYLKLTLNSIFYNCKGNQKLYIVASSPDAETEKIIRACVDSNINVEAVITSNNLGYGISNFGSKFFALRKFIHFEDDGILPESLSYNIPYWTQQLNYRSHTADFVGFRVSEHNKNTQVLRMESFSDTEVRPLVYDDTQLWNYFDVSKDQLPAISGNGLVIDSAKMYCDHDKIGSFHTDLSLYWASERACIINIPVYHLGANQLMDFRSKAKPPETVDTIQIGTNIRTGETKLIDLSVDWAAYAND